MSLLRIILAVYGVLLVVGAYFGHRAGSPKSLVAGIISGALVLAGLYWSQSQPKAGFTLIAGVCTALIVVFLIRFTKTHNFMPSGMLMLLSALALIVSIIGLTKV